MSLSREGWIEPPHDRYRVCSRCVMDTSDPRIVFDEKGECNHCRRLSEKLKDHAARGTFSEENYRGVVRGIKEAGKGKEFDCILGLSGGVDSSYLALIAAELGLRPLYVHLDNGWNSENAVRNIERIIRRFGRPLHTHVIDWEEFKDLQLAVMRASVIDIEMLTDHAIAAVTFSLAERHGIGTILSGANLATEAILPYSWAYYKSDLLNILAIHHLFGSTRLSTFPMMDPGMMRRCFSAGVARVGLLNHIDYHFHEAVERLEEELGWEYYGGKHWESTFTRFYQEYILPRKFGVDKRRAHFSNLILNGEMTREEALGRMEEVPFPTDERKDYVLKKLGLSEDEFERMMEAPPRNHWDYPASYPPPWIPPPPGTPAF